MLKVCRQPAAISGAGGQTPGGRPGRREWSWSKAEVEAFDPPAQSLTGRGAGAALGPVPGVAPPLAARSRSGAGPAARLLSIPPTEPSGAAEAARGRGAPRGSGPEQWGRGS